jgi:peptidoglycan/LPS O-acetylase OafA/YrhL
VVGVARAAVRASAGTILSLLGFYSLEIYLGHPLFGTASRAVLGRSSVHGAIPLVAAGVCAGLFASLALAILCRKGSFPYLYRWPSTKRSANA